MDLSHSEIRVLVVDHEKRTAISFQKAMKNIPFVFETAATGKEALLKLETFPAEIVIANPKIRDMNGMKLLETIKFRHPDIFILAVSDNAPSVNTIRAGAYRNVPKSGRAEDMRTAVENIIAHREVLRSNYYKGAEKRKRYRFENIVGQDPKMFEIFQKITDVANTGTTVLITGESGTGKELVADAIHFKSARKSGPFIKVNCAALTDSLINSELFGYEKGAFTGADTQKKGYFEFAAGGTIFIDEIADISIPTQTSLLRVIETGSIQRVGNPTRHELDVRIICATNKDLLDAANKGLFRHDLYYRINVVGIRVPPLRERKSDIPLLANHFLEKYRGILGKKITRISETAMDMMIGYNWPGNVRQLANTIENAAIFSKKNEILPEDLQDELRENFGGNLFRLELNSKSLPNAESTLITRVLEETNWNLKKAATDLEIARATLYSKMKKYGIQRPG